MRCCDANLRCIMMKSHYMSEVDAVSYCTQAPQLESKIGLGDTCGVHNLHGMPGLLGGFVAGLAAFGQAAGAAPHGRAQIG
jgi:ammonia channel protein AmtB